MRFLSIIILSLATLAAQAQQDYTKFQWKNNPSLHQINSKYAEDAAVYISEKKVVEYVIEKDGFYAYKTTHRIIHINNDKGIEYFNKVYLSFDEAIQVVDVKARTILPGGKVIVFDEKNIKDLQEDERTYKIFAIDGLTKGCEVEYYYTTKNYPSFFGREMISTGVPVMKSRFELITPGHLFFDAKTYNGLPPCKDTINNEKRHLYFDAENLDASAEEKYSMETANLKRVEYKLSYNKAKNENERMFTWNELAKKAHEIYTSASEKELKRIKSLVSETGIKESMSEREKIVLLENYFKKNYITREDISEDDAGDLMKVIKNKVSSERAYCKLFALALSALNVDYHIVLTGDRADYTVDRNLENWNNARNFLFYFPATKKFLAPTATIYRYPWIPPTWAGTNGLFCVVTSLGTLKTAIGEVRSIPMEEYQYSFLNMEIKAALDKNFDALELDIKQLYGGYAAPNYKAPFVFMPVEEQKNVLKEMVKFGTNSENMLSHSFENKEMDVADPYRPFIINAKVKSAQLVELAGNKIIIKVGELIGEQSQMYDTKERTTNIDLHFPHALVRTIELAIPDGYEVKNLGDLRFNEVYQDKNKVTIGFVCSYEQKGNILKITIREDYTEYFYPAQLYAPFKKVINAAADFNKVVLVLDKKL